LRTDIFVEYIYRGGGQMYRMIIYNIFIIKTPKNTFFILVSRIYISLHII
jgi:hypothetical protein